MAFFRSGSDGLFGSARSEGFLSGAGSDLQHRLFSRESMHDYSRLPTQESTTRPPPVSMVHDSQSLVTENNVQQVQTLELGAMDVEEAPQETNEEQAFGRVSFGPVLTKREQGLAERREKRVKEVLSEHATERPFFQSFIGIVILVNSLLMGMEIDYPWYGWLYLEHILLCIYVFELFLRLKTFGTLFFSCHNEDVVWNLLDFTIVISSVLDLWITPLCGEIMKHASSEHETIRKEEQEMSLGKVMMLMRMLRLMRILRLAKLVKSVRPLFILVTGVMAALQGVAWVLVLTIVTLYAMGILATSLIGKKMVFPPHSNVPDAAVAPFRTVPDSMFTLFRIMSGAASDTDIVAVDIVTGDVPPIKLAFVIFMITCSWTLLSILTAVVSDNMISTTGQHDEEHKIAKEEDDRMHHMQRLREVFHNMAVRGDGQVEKHEIETFLSDEHNASLTANCCGVPVRDVREVLQSVAEACTGTTVSLEDFVEHLADVSHVVTEKSMMKIEAKLINVSRQQLEHTKELHKMLMSWQEKSSIDGVLEPQLGTISSSKSLQNEAERDGKDFRTDSVSKKEHVAASDLKATQNEAEVACRDQLKNIERRMEEIAEQIEACLKGIGVKNQRLDEGMTAASEQALPKIGVDTFSEMLELRLSRMQHELLCNLRAQAPDIANARDCQEAVELTAMNSIADQELCTTPKSLILDSAVGLCDAIEREKTELLYFVSEDTHASQNQSDFAEPAWASGAEMKLSASQMVARLHATEESIRGLQQKIQSMLRKHEGLAERMSKVVDQGLSAHAFDKLSETLDELRILRQESLELLCIIGRQDPEVSKLRIRLQEDSRLAASDATAAGMKEETSLTPMNSIIKGSIGLSPRAATEPECKD